MLASLHAGTVRKRSLLGLCYRRSRPDGDHAGQRVDPWSGPHRDRNFDSDRGVDLVHWLGHPLCRVGVAMNAFVLSGYSHELTYGKNILVLAATVGRQFLAFQYPRDRE